MAASYSWIPTEQLHSLDSHRFDVLYEDTGNRDEAGDNLLPFDRLELSIGHQLVNRGFCHSSVFGVFGQCQVGGHGRHCTRRVRAAQATPKNPGSFGGRGSMPSSAWLSSA